MSTINTTLHLPNYAYFLESIAVLDLPFSASELHGVMCGYLSAGATREGDAYLRALMSHRQGQDARKAASSLFNVYAVSQQQITGHDFDFQLLLPDENASLRDRTQAFSEWCEGYAQGINLAGIDFGALDEEEVQEAFDHITEFAQLDYESLDVGDEDERALMEVSEYTRMAVLRIYSELQAEKIGNLDDETAH
jgi:yecA family protein